MAGSGQVLFDRRCKLTVATPVDTPGDFKTVTSQVTEIDGGFNRDRSAAGLRIQFHIVKTLKKNPNTSEIKVTNLSPNRRASLQKKGVKVLLEAGYAGTGMAKYFSGDVRTIDHVREQADWTTVMQLGDGERAWQFARVSESFAPGTPVSSALRAIADAMGLEMGNSEEQASALTATLDQGYAAAGSAARAFDQIVRANGLEWSIQDGQLQVLRPDQSLSLPIPEITPDTGLIGSPEMGTPPKKGKPQLVKFKSLLLWTKPGAKVKLVSKRYNGYVRVQSCEFTGDTHGGDWYTEIAGVIT